MEKNTKNPDSVNSDSVKSLSAASIVRIDPQRNNDAANSRNCESQSSKQRPLPKSQEIDKQISELACLIRRLQDEIVELSRNATKNPSLVDTFAKDDDKKTQTFNVTKQMDCSSGFDDTTTIVGTVHTQPAFKDSSGIDAEEKLQENVVNIDKGPYDNLDYALMNCSLVASGTEPDPFRKPKPDQNVYDNVYHLNMEHGTDENEDDNADDGEKVDVTDNETEDEQIDENEHGSEFDFGPDIGDTTVVENNYDVISNVSNMDDAES